MFDIIGKLYEPLRRSDDLQLAYKISATHSVHYVNETVKYYINNSGKASTSTLDTSKGFEMLNLLSFNKVFERKIIMSFHSIVIVFKGGVLSRMQLYFDHLSVTCHAHLVTMPTNKALALFNYSYIC